MGSKKHIDKESQNLFSLVKDRFGDRLTPNELEEVRKDVRSIAEACTALRAVRLANSDEPFFVFKPHKGKR